MSNLTTMTYGGYSFTPVPLVSIKRNSLQVRNIDAPIGYAFEMTLNGTLTPLPENNQPAITDLDILMEELRSAFNRDGKLLEIKCGLQTVMQIYPRIREIEFRESNNNWVQTVPYTIVLEYDKDELNEDYTESNIPPYIEEFNEEWQMEWVQENTYFSWDLSTVSDQQSGYDYTANDSNNPFEIRVTHNISVKGKQSWEGPGATGVAINGATNALSWLNNVYNDYGYNPTSWGHSLTGWNNLPYSSGEYGVFDHFRSHIINETEGSVSLTETWLVVGTNSGLQNDYRKGTEDFNISVTKNIENDLVNVSVEGTIRGFQERYYGDIADSTDYPLNRAGAKTAYSNASDMWSKIQDRVFPRAQFIYEQDYLRTLNPAALNKVIGHSPTKGTITYSYQFNDRPCSFITGSLSENFTMTDNYPSDVFASLPVLGRGQGPVLQEISTVTEATREITIEAVMPTPTGCGSITGMFAQNKPTENVENILCQFETQLTLSNSQVFKNSDSESWNPLTGRYTRSVSWTYQDCDTSPDTSFC